MVRQSGFHRRSYAQRTVNPTEIVVGKVQRDSRFQVFELLAEAQTETRHSPEKCSYAKVATLNVRRADHLRVEKNYRLDETEDFIPTRCSAAL